MLTKNYPKQAGEFFDLLFNNYSGVGPKHPVRVLLQEYGSIRSAAKVGKGPKDNAIAAITGAKMVLAFNHFKAGNLKIGRADLKWQYKKDLFPSVGKVEFDIELIPDRYKKQILVS